MLSFIRGWNRPRTLKARKSMLDLQANSTTATLANIAAKASTNLHEYKIASLSDSTPLYLGIGGVNRKNIAQFNICVSDGTNPVHYLFREIEFPQNQDLSKPEILKQRGDNIQNEIIECIDEFQKANDVKIIGATLLRPLLDSWGVTRLPEELWSKLDIVPFVLDSEKDVINYDFGPNSDVPVDANGKIHLVNIDDYKKTVSKETWDVLMKITERLRDEQDLKIAFFNATPQGGGVALMRHAGIRLFRLLGVKCRWFVPFPDNDVFRITKNNHNILQGVADPNLRLTEDNKKTYEAWIKANVEKYWLNDVFRECNVIFIDDPQMVGLIPYIKEVNPACKILYRSHIQIRADLANTPGSPQNGVWSYLWSFIQHCDLFVSHPVLSFIPDEVPLEKTVLMPAASDPIDGLNKELSDDEMDYYLGIFNRICEEQGTKNTLDPERPNVIQIARFDPAKGIPDVIDSYAILRKKMYDADYSLEKTPQLVICGHGAIDDPDASIIYAQVMEQLKDPKYKDIVDDIIVARLPPSDQLLDAVLRRSYLALQLSHREGFEVKVTEALAKGIPVVAARAGGIPLQIKDGKTGFLCEVGDCEAVAQRMFELFDNPRLHARMSKDSSRLCTEEFWTIFNYMHWMFMASEIYEKGALVGNRRWIKEFWYEKYNYTPIQE
jgi:glycosyltransferase involved in cell wall biosynthesis